MREQIKELLEKFNYQTSEHVLTALSQILSNKDLPKNQYAIKHYSLFIKNNISGIDLKKSHLIEMVSRFIFKEKWHILSKQIPKNFKLDMTSRMIQYVDISIDLTCIDDIDLLADKILFITTKNNKEIQIIHEKSDDLFRWCKANAFPTSVDYWSTEEEPEFPSWSDMPKSIYLKLITMNSISDVKKGKEWKDDSEICFNYSFKINGEELVQMSMWWLEPERIAYLLTADKIEESFLKLKNFFIEGKAHWEEMNEDKLG